MVQRQARHYWEESGFRIEVLLALRPGTRSLRSLTISISPLRVLDRQICMQREDVGYAPAHLSPACTSTRAQQRLIGRSIPLLPYQRRACVEATGLLDPISVIDHSATKSRSWF